jgi:heme-degrading monooxygenase HmoA
LEGSNVKIQIVTFESELPEESVWSVARDRLEAFRALPGLIQKYYVRSAEPNRFGGVYIWDSMESLSAYLKSDLAASTPAAYKVKGAPTVEILDLLFPLREKR